MASLDDKQQASLNAIFYDAVSDRNLERAKLCISRGAQLGPANMREYFQNRGEDPVPLAHVACSHFNNDILKELVAGGMPVDEKDGEGYTALARAVDDQSVDRVKAFIAAGASPLAANNDGRTILDIARENQSYQGAYRDTIIDALLNAMPAAGSDFNAAAPPRDVSTSEDIQISKPISLAPHKKNGFEL